MNLPRRASVSRDGSGSRTPIQFHIANDHKEHPIDAQIVQAATKWERIALRQFGMGPGEGLVTDMRTVFIYGIGWTLKDGFPHALRAADYDDWVTETRSRDGHPMRGLNGDILVWNPVTKRRHELTSMGIRVNAETLRKPLEIARQLGFPKLPYHQAILRNELPLSIGGGIGRSHACMLLLEESHPGEVSVTVWPKALNAMCREKKILVLE